MLSVVTFVCQDEAGLLTPTPSTTPSRSQLFSMSEETFEQKVLKFSDGEEEEVGGDSGKGIEVFTDHEAEDRLDQLLMDEELSDVHITELAMSAENKQQQEANKQQEVNGREQEVNDRKQEVAVKELDKQKSTKYSEK